MSKIPKGPDDIAVIVTEGMCIGCGVCVGVCPRPTSIMVMSEAGLWEPRFINAECPPSCGRCTAVCPFIENAPNEGEIGSTLFANQLGVTHNDFLGYSLVCLAGYHPDETVRFSAASGGIVTHIFELAIDCGLVNTVACVGPYCSNTNDFSIQLVEKAEDIRRCASSKYFPVHYADLLRQLLREKRLVALVALPCQAKALRLAANVDPRLKESLVLIVALTCGQMKNAWFTRNLARNHVGTEVLADVLYRVKRVDASAYDYAFQFVHTCVSDNGNVMVPAHVIGPLWESRWCSAYPCCYCDDVFGECADISAMDAWHLPYSKDGRGTTLVVVRSAKAAKLLANSLRSGILHTIDPAVVSASQAGTILDKRAGVAYRYRLANYLGLPSRKRRTTASRVGIAQHFMWTGAYLSAASWRTGERRWRASVMVAGSILFMALGKAVSRVALVLRGLRMRYL